MILTSRLLLAPSACILLALSPRAVVTERLLCIGLILAPACAIFKGEALEVAGLELVLRAFFMRLGKGAKMIEQRQNRESIKKNAAILEVGINEGHQS